MRQPVPFGKYLLLDRISVGGMAEVFKAKSYGVEGFEKIIAIKRILPTMGEDRDFIKMFIDEAKIAGQLAHANICQIFELGRIDGSHFIAMEYIWGKDLLQIQNRVRKLKGHIPVPMACFTISKVLEGLDYAHRKRDPLGRPLEIVHRDCSPQNVLVSYEGEVKVIDFGIAKATSRNSRTMAGVLKGKFGYMSPEQVRGLPLDRRSDIFALGTMLYECLTGERLFQGETDFSTLEKVRNVDVQPPRAINPNIPEEIERVILKALAKDVDDRYQWCSEMLADLQKFLMSQDVVFTAKSLSQWLKETFAAEIDRERQQLEQYKRVGRDGLIAGVPAAEAKLDVVEHLGEAGAPEGDATTLGGPNFDDIEHAAGASPTLGLNLNAPTERGPLSGARPVADPRGPAKKATKPGPAAAAPVDDGRFDARADNAPTMIGDEDDSDFEQEAPTEIFGDDAAGTPPPVAAAIPAAGRAPSAPPKGRASTIGPGANRGSAPPMAASSGAMRAPSAMTATPDANTFAVPYAQSAGSQPVQQMMQHPSGQVGAMPLATPPAMAAEPGAQPQPTKTVLGMQAPVLSKYGGYRPSPPPGQSMQGAAMQAPMGSINPPMGQPMQHGYPQMGGYPQQGGMAGYTAPGNMMPAPAIEPLAPVVEGKRSTLVRDIGIGVGIAALVLVGFLVVKIFVLDKSDEPAQTSSSIATVKIGLTPGITAELFVDDKKVASVTDGQSVPITPGLRRIKLVGPNNARCEEPIKLDPGKTTPIECAMYVGGGSGAAKGSGSDAAATATGSAGAAVAVATEAPKPATNDTAVKTEATKPTDIKDTKDSAATDVAKDIKTVKPAETKDTAAKDTAAKSVSDTKKPASDVKDVKTTKPTDTKKPTTTEVKKPDTSATKPSGDTPPADDASKGFLQVFAKPAAKIQVDGNDVGKTPIQRLPLAPGKHKITFIVNDDRYTYPIVIKVGQTETMSKDLQ